MTIRTLLFFLALLTSVPHAAALELILPETAFQGDMVVGRVVPPADVWTRGKSLMVSKQGYFVIGIPRDQKNDAVVLAKNGTARIKRTIRTLARQWQVERINGLPKKKVSPDKNTLKRIHADAKKVNAVRVTKPYPVGYFLDSNGFTLPLKGRISGVFGSQRILNAKPRSPHRGVDIAAPMGTPVVSPADGVVCLVANDMVLMGNTLMVDHGLGVRSIFIHLDRILVKNGDRVTQGELIAKVGQSGRATGPHLHWGVFVGTIAIDPQRVVKK
jgi:murein DD-endopeptidase MepM/ murein hydrolase activator NlpD